MASRSGWSEIEAVYEREGIFGLLQWLGLPASRQTLAILRNITDPDLARRLLEPLRADVVEPEAIWTLTHARAITDECLAACHALAAYSILSRLQYSPVKTSRYWAGCLTRDASSETVHSAVRAPAPFIRGNRRSRLHDNGIAGI